jgi:hypothetical protein
MESMRRDTWGCASKIPPCCFVGAEVLDHVFRMGLLKLLLKAKLAEQVFIVLKLLKLFRIGA